MTMSLRMSWASCLLIFIAQPMLGYAALPFNYQLFGEDWKSLTDTWCDSVEQTPIDIMAPSELSQYDQMPQGFVPSFQLPVVDHVTATNNGYNINLEFSTNEGSTFPFPAGGTFTSLSGPYQGKKAPSSSAATTQTSSIGSKTAYPEGDATTPEFAQGTLIDLHWHEPSEHSIDGKLYPAEAHFVHIINRPDDPDCTYFAGDQGPFCLAVIGVFYDMVIDEAMNSSEAIAFTSMMLALGNLPDVNQTDTDPISVDFEAFLPESKEFWHYRGSLTTPECNENVTWYVLQEPMSMGWSQWNELKNSMLYDELGDLNARPPLPLNNRTVFVTNYDDFFGDPAMMDSAGTSMAPEAGAFEGDSGAIPLPTETP